MALMRPGLIASNNKGKTVNLISPYGEELKDLYLSNEETGKVKEQAKNYLSWDLTPRQLCDIEMLLNGAFSPLEGFMGKVDYDSVVQEMRLADGVLWPMPITLDVSVEFAEQTKAGNSIALRDQEGVLIAVLDITDIWTPNKDVEAEKVYSANDEDHPAIHYLHHQAGNVYIGGKLKGIEPPHYYDFPSLRQSPKAIREHFTKLGWVRVVAFQTRNPMHRAQIELTQRAAKQTEANLFIHPVVGMTNPGDIDHYSRVRCYEHIVSRLPEQTTQLSLLPLAMRMAGPREAVWHAIIRRNYGCTHIIIGRDHAGPGKNSQGESYYGPYDAQELVAKHQDELGIEMVPFQNMVYVEDLAEYIPESEIQPDQKILNISGTEFRRRLNEGLDIPGWFSFPEVMQELRKTYPSRDKQGVTIFFTGLSGSGKSTVANALMVKLMEMGGRKVTLLDGDIVRKNLSSELGFSKEHRDLNILRIGYVASEITKNGGVAICAPIAPYRATRRKVREMIEAEGGFIEIHVSTPMAVCESRDRKGLYAKARAGLIKEFTGVSDPYEIPEKAELSIDTSECKPEEAVQRIILKMEKLGFIK